MNTSLAETVRRFNAYADDPVTVARRLLGQRLVRQLGGERLAGTIVEVEAYLGEQDRAAHSFGGRRTPRNESMYLPGGHAYVYLIYGIHHCLNIVCGEAEEGVAILIRAIEPTEGIEHMQTHRCVASRSTSRRLTDLCSGPGKLAQALAIDRDLDGIDLHTSDVLWVEQTRCGVVPRSQVLRSARIGVEYAGVWAERPLRFSLKGNAHLSR